MGGSSGDVVEFKRLLELDKEVGPGFKVDRDGGGDHLVEGHYPGKGGPFGHARKCKHKLLDVSGVNVLVYFKVEDNVVKSGHGSGAVTIECIRGAKAKFNWP